MGADGGKDSLQTHFDSAAATLSRWEIDWSSLEARVAAYGMSQTSWEPCTFSNLQGYGITFTA
jgi:hypothetical protein